MLQYFCSFQTFTCFDDDFVSAVNEHHAQRMRRSERAVHEFENMYGVRLSTLVGTHCLLLLWEAGTALSIATGNGLGGRGSIPSETGDFSLLHGVQTDFGAHPFFSPVGTGVSFPGGKATGP
jgi:hypothetical protein